MVAIQILLRATAAHPNTVTVVFTLKGKAMIMMMTSGALVTAHTR